MFEVRFDGLILIPSKSAMREMCKYAFDLEDCKEILESGYEIRRRAKNTIEKWKDYGSKTYNIVIVKSYNGYYNQDVYLITHLGKFTKRSIRK